MRVNIAIVGGGIVGLAVAQLLRRSYPDKSVVVLEKESAVAAHQTGHNSGVLHTGIYYKPGSYKATNCARGKRMMEAFCRENGVPFEICGKVIVATDASELPGLEKIYERGVANGVRCSILSGDELREVEPHVNGIRALRVPDAGIVDYVAVAQAMAKQIHACGGQVHTGTKLLGAELRSGSTVLKTTGGDIEASLVINCAGLQSDRVARLLGCHPKVKIIPFRGEYFKLQGESKNLCQNLVYPVPNPEFPFLGVHYTRMISGEVECGPNAVLAFAREGYTKTTLNVVDLGETLIYPGFLKFISKHLGMGLAEMWRSVNKGAFLKSLQRLIPEVKANDLLPAPAGVRAQAISFDGKFVDDFVIEESKGVINVLNAPSPAATSSLSLAEYIVGQAARQEGWEVVGGVGQVSVG
jgi:L-2-hydroxyglutarate oxidase